MEESHAYSEGDWIVHSHYGVGKIKGVEVKCISGEDTPYYRITTTNSTFWVPLEQMNSDVLRPLSTPEEIELAIVLLKEPAEEMSSNSKVHFKVKGFNPLQMKKDATVLILGSRGTGKTILMKDLLYQHDVVRQRL